MILVAFPEMRPLAEDLALALGADLLALGWHHFPDGESLISLPGDLDGADVAFLATLRDPDRLALPLRFAAAKSSDRVGAATRNHQGALHFHTPLLYRAPPHRPPSLSRRASSLQPNEPQHLSAAADVWASSSSNARGDA
mgnify:CR=1 FL=1